MDATGYREQLGRLGLTQTAAATALGVDDRTSRRWATGERSVPGTVARLLWACERDPELLRLLRDEWRDEAEDVES